MKRKGNLYEQMCSIENLMLAEKKARKRKSKQYGIKTFDKNKDAHIQRLHEALISETYRISDYKTFLIYEPKERMVFKLPYIDRIVQHAIMIVIEQLFTPTFTADSYSCIKEKGIHAASNAVKKALCNKQDTAYCLKLDIRKYYPSVNHDILKQLIRRKIKDSRLLRLLDGIIDSADGLPIGNYLSQLFANVYLNGFDHWLKEQRGVKHYFRYADDMVILGGDKPYLHDLLGQIQLYLQTQLKLEVKRNYQIFPVAVRGIDFVGYKHYHSHTLLRKSIKKNFARSIAKGAKQATIASYKGWAKHANTKHLLKKLLHENV